MTTPTSTASNRVTSSRWTKDLATDVDFYDVDLTYDRNSNITMAIDNVHEGFDVIYTMEDLNRLTRAQEGSESSGSITSETRDKTWALDTCRRTSEPKLFLPERAAAESGFDKEPRSTWGPTWLRMCLEHPVPRPAPSGRWQTHA